MNLSEHFTLEELTRTAQPFPNVPNAQEIANLKALCVNVLEPIRAHYKMPVHVNSGFRSAKVNAAVGSKPTSWHRKGCAADIEIGGVTNAALACWVRDNLKFAELILENYRPGIVGSGWVHVAYCAGANTKKVKTMRMGSHGPVYSIGINA